MKKLFALFVRGFLALLSGLLWILSIPRVRDWIWGKIVGKSKKKVIDARAKVVKGEGQKYEK